MGFLSRFQSTPPPRALRAEDKPEASDQAASRLLDEGNSLEDKGSIEEARQRYEAAIRLAPNLARAYLNRGNILLAMGNTDGALEAYAAALARNPDFAAAHFNVGNAHFRLQRYDAALSAYSAAIAIKPDFVDAEVARARVCEELGRFGEAEAGYRRALSVRSDYAEVHSNLGSVLKNRGQKSAAVQSFRRAVELKPEFADAHFGLGNVLEEIGDLQCAQASFRRALELNPDFVEARGNLGAALCALGQLDEAESSFRRVIDATPEDFKSHLNLGIVLQDLGRLDEAAASFRRALQIKPDAADAYGNLLFCLTHSESVDANKLFLEHCRFGDQIEAPLRATWPQHRNSRDAARCLQVGFVSGDFRTHPVAHFVEPLLAHLAAYQTLSLHAYHNHRVEDDVTRRLQKHFRHWHPIAGLSDSELAERITRDGIDILIDVSGHTGGNRLVTFAQKPAPLHVSWVGYPGTTGLKAVDYYFADRHFLPPGMFDSQFTEKLVHLPAIAPFMPDENSPPVNDLPALRNGYVTFGSFNRISKISRSAVALWSIVLRTLPDAQMLLGAMPQKGDTRHLIDWFAQEGIVSERLHFHSRCGFAEYLALHHQVDICLDTLPYSGGTTTNHALWMGLPTFSLGGATPAGRHGAANLGHVGLGAFVAKDAADFQEKGVHWARNLAALSALRAGLRQRCEQSPLRRPETIAAGMESALRIMWQRWCAGMPPESFEVAALHDVMP